MTSKRRILTCLQHQFRNGPEDLERASVTADFWPGYFTYGDESDKWHWLVYFRASKIPLGQVCKNMTLFYSSTWLCRTGKQNSSLHSQCDLTIERELTSLKFDWP